MTFLCSTFFDPSQEKIKYEKRGDTVEQWSALLPHSKIAQILGLGPFCVDFHVPCVCWVFPQFKSMHIRPVIDLKLSIGVNVSAISSLQ